MPTHVELYYFFIRRFSLGSRLHVNRYIQQFTEIFTEEGRKSVKITHQVQGHMPRVMYTQSMREKERLKEKEEQQQQHQPASAGGVQPIPLNKEPPDNQIPSAAASASVKVIFLIPVNFHHFDDLLNT